ncbi:MAG: DUF2191 domain-containing protein [Solirubrobacterales bacterium]|nr:DUF2191 domain-containing protein [Solirubrobacterales bacterium]
MCVATRTTITFDDGLLQDAKREALERGVSLAALVQDALRAELARREAAGDEPFELIVFEGGGELQPGVELDSNAALADLLDRERA